MKKLSNVIALFILVSVNVLTPVSYAQENLEGGWVTNKYTCSLGETGYYTCEMDTEGDFTCYEFSCEYNGVLYPCWESSNGYECYIGRYNRSSEPVDGGYYFEPNLDGEYYCESSHVESLNASDLRSASYYGEYNCRNEEEAYYWCDYREGMYFCPTDLYVCSETVDWYSCVSDEENWHYYCESDIEWEGIWPDKSVEFRAIMSEWTYTCYDIYGYDDPIYNCEEPELKAWWLWYFCPYPKYSCEWEDWWYLCTEGYTWEWEDYYYCIINYHGDDLAKWGSAILGDYSCYQPYGYKGYAECYFEDDGEYFCVPKYSCELDGDGYNCAEDPYWRYQCDSNGPLLLDSDVLTVDSANWYYCYYRNNTYSNCSKNSNDNYFCPVKWWVKMDWNWEYECLAENAEYSEVEWQCVYEIEDILWNTTTIMSSNLWATETNPMWDFYQWWSNYKYPRYPYNALNNWDCNLDENGNWDCPLDGYEYYLEEELQDKMPTNTVDDSDITYSFSRYQCDNNVTKL